MKIAENFEEMVELGQQFLTENPTVYPDDFVQRKTERFAPFFENDDELLKTLYAAVYCQQEYGTSLIEFGTYHFAEKSHCERKEYITWDSRFLYMAFLNKSSDNHILDNKYEAYNLLKPFYKREAMLLSDENDYDDFCAFVKRSPNVFVKPNNLELAEGAHRLNYADGNLRNTFDALLKEAANISSTDVKREIDHKLILEEFIVPSQFIRQLNPNDISLLRVTTVYVKGKVHFFYPVLRLLVGNGKEEIGEDYSYVALVDSESGEVISNGKNSLGDTDFNPVTGLEIRGIKLPEWEELKEMLEKAAKMLPTTRYIGWDVTHTDKGWCIIEGNTNGEFFYQMCAERGLKEEFENLIGFKVPYDFWKNPMFRKREAKEE